MTPEQEAAKKVADQKAADEAAKKAADDAANASDPLKIEAERVRKESECKTELEKAIFTYKKNGRTQESIRQRIVDLGGNPDDIDGKSAGADDDNATVTVGMLKKIDQDKAAKTALVLAQEQIQDETERDLVIHHLTNTIKPSGNPVTDLANARAIVNSVKSTQIAEEIARKLPPRRTGKASGAPANQEDGFEPTPEEASYMRPPFNLSKDKILAARKQAGAQG